MDHLNQELLRARLMRGALAGAPEPEKTAAVYCKGKLDNGRPCRITVLDGEYCIRHKKEIEALELGAPLPPGRVERTNTEARMAKHRCNHKGCTRPVRNDGDFCWQHNRLEDQAQAGVVESAEGATSDGGTDQVLLDTGVGLEAGGAVSTLAERGQPEGALDAQSPPEPAKSDVAPPPPEEGDSALSRLLRKPEAVSPTSIMLDFEQYEFEAIQEERLTAAEIKQLVLYLIAGELQRVVNTKGPACHRD